MVPGLWVRPQVEGFDFPKEHPQAVCSVLMEGTRVFFWAGLPVRGSIMSQAGGW